jgi:hypothetical protein
MLDVVGNHDSARCYGSATNQQIKIGDHQPGFVQSRFLLCEQAQTMTDRDDLNPTNKLFNPWSDSLGITGIGDPEKKFGHGDFTDGAIGLAGLLQPQHYCIVSLQIMDTNIGVKQELSQSIGWM